MKSLKRRLAKLSAPKQTPIGLRRQNEDVAKDIRLGGAFMERYRDTFLALAESKSD